MPTSTKDHRTITFRYMQVLAFELATILNDHGITGLAIQRKIVESFLFGMGVGWDQFYITDFSTGRTRVRPAICFRQESGELIVADPEEEFHHWAPFEANESVFEPDDSGSDLDFVYDNGSNGEIPFSTRLRSNE